MSTKSTIAINMPDFPKDSPNIEQVPTEQRDPLCPYYRLYEECFEEDASVYLELENPEVVVSNEMGILVVTLKIPAQVWNRIIIIGPRGEKHGQKNG